MLLQAQKRTALHLHISREPLRAKDCKPACLDKKPSTFLHTAYLATKVVQENFPGNIILKLFLCESYNKNEIALPQESESLCRAGR